MSMRSIGMAGEGALPCVSITPSPKLKLHSQLQFDFSPGERGRGFGWLVPVITLPTLNKCQHCVPDATIYGAFASGCCSRTSAYCWDFAFEKWTSMVVSSLVKLAIPVS